MVNNFSMQNAILKKKWYSNTQIGNKIPSLKIHSIFGEGNMLDFLSHNLIIFFYPKDDTPGCTIEASEFTANHKVFLDLNTQVVGISRDSLISHAKFKDKYKLSINLISDESEELCKVFDVIKEKNMYGKKVFGIERSTFFIDKNGILQKQWRKVSVKDHVHKIIEFLKTLSS
jgi:peroxiredoxin Q/BCP